MKIKLFLTTMAVAQLTKVSGSNPVIGKFCLSN